MNLKRWPFVLIVLLLIGNLSGSTYHVAIHGNDDYTIIQARNVETPWRTIGKAAGIVVAGDSIIIHEGTYYESNIEFTNSGTHDAWIVIINEPGSKPIITGDGERGFYFYGNRYAPYTKSNFIVSGLTFQGYKQDGISIYWSDYIICEKIRAHDNGNAGIIVVGSNHIIIQDSYLHHNGWKSDGDSGWGDGASINNHYFEDPQGWYSVVRRNLMYANWQKRDGSYWDGNGFTWDMAGTNGAHILANNVFFNNGGCGVMAVQTGNMVMVHNVLFRNMADYYRCRNESEIQLALDWVDNIIMKNNIVYSRSKTATYSELKPILLENANKTDMELIERNLIWGELGEETDICWHDYMSLNDWINTIAPTTLTGNPGFVSAPHDNELTTFHGVEWIQMDVIDYDFHLTANSQCIDQGAFLTETTAGGSGREIPVEEARYFTDGFGIEDQGDVIQVGLNTPLRITSVDYHNNVITVNQSVSWNDGDGVSLLYYGPAPDIGAYEYSLQYLPHQSYDIHATLSLTRPITWGDKTISILLTTSKRVIKVPTPLILNECDGTTTNIPLEGEIPGQNFFGNLKLDDSIADGPAFFQLPEESLIGIEGSVGNTIIQEDSIYIDQKSPNSPLSIEIKK